MKSASSSFQRISYKSYNSCSRVKAKGLFFVIMVLLWAPFAHSQEDSVSPQTHERRPEPGDKLGYSKEESDRRLNTTIKEFLDGLLRIYNEPKLFANRMSTIAALGSRPGTRVLLPLTVPPQPGPRAFSENFEPLGIFAHPGWRGTIRYLGWNSRPYGETWYSVIRIKIDKNIDCVDSRATEGYLNLFLDPGLDGIDHLVSKEYWDRHKSGGTPRALRTSNYTPGITFVFVHGCVTEIAVGGSFNYKDISDENILN